MHDHHPRGSPDTHGLGRDFVGFAFAAKIHVVIFELLCGGKLAQTGFQRHVLHLGDGHAQIPERVEAGRHIAV